MESAIRTQGRQDGLDCRGCINTAEIDRAGTAVESRESGVGRAVQSDSRSI